MYPEKYSAEKELNDSVEDMDEIGCKVIREGG